MVAEAYKIGYRHFDIATFYRNEEDFGKEFKKYRELNCFINSQTSIFLLINVHTHYCTFLPKYFELILTAKENLNIGFYN